ncbi:MAG TPA: hypothetical protein DEQ38_02335 [Elusimicrobia bacterium]|nr:MAG: hypothetical protein A2089_10865 [Elusimicrobia bacterium GWD2_63_28]HCC46948.1 hypothetical protein [Elusimicrobiota bacterium]
MKCPKCGRANEKWDAYCVSCQTELKASVEAAPGPAPAEKAARRAPATAAEKKLALIGLAFAVAGNGFFALYWKSEMNSGTWPGFAGVTTLVSALVGYYFGLRIVQTGSFLMGGLYGLLGGAIVGVINGSWVFPGFGSVVGLGIGAVIGLVCGFIYAAIAPGSRRAP